jgi:hypothetical protein
MVGARNKFRNRDIQRAVKATKSAGLDPVAVEVNPNSGVIKILTSKSTPNEGELDQWMAKHASSVEGH